MKKSFMPDSFQNRIVTPIKMAVKKIEPPSEVEIVIPPLDDVELPLLLGDDVDVAVLFVPSSSALT
jgi:hypothetical protein